VKRKWLDEEENADMGYPKKSLIDASNIRDKENNPLLD